MAVALIVAAGRGERLGSGRPKALVSLAGRPMLEWSVGRCRRLPAWSGSSSRCRPTVSGKPQPGRVPVVGGAVRSQSVREALGASGAGDPVIVHDAARPLASPALFEQALAELADSGADAVIAAVPVADTIKEVGEGGHAVTRTLDASAAVGRADSAGVSPRGSRERAARRIRGAARRGNRRRVADRARRRRGTRSGVQPREPQGHDLNRSAKSPSCCWQERST